MDGSDDDAIRGSATAACGGRSFAVAAAAAGAGGREEAELGVVAEAATVAVAYGGKAVQVDIISMLLDPPWMKAPPPSQSSRSSKHWALRS